MLEVPEDGCARNRLFRAIDESFRTGDFAALGRALGGAPRWFDEDMPLELGLGHPLGETVDAYYRGLWMLLAFTMQMTLILVLALVIAATPVFKKAIAGLSKLPTTATGVVALACLTIATIAYTTLPIR